MANWGLQLSSIDTEGAEAVGKRVGEVPCGS